MTNRRTLILNSDYSGYSVISWRRAMVLMLAHQDNPSEGAYVAEYYPNEYISDSKGCKYPIPAVMVLVKYARRKKTIAYSRRAVIIRDKMRCGYCGNKFKYHQLTIDHIIAKSKWDVKKQGPFTVFSNVISCCSECNRRKGNKKPEEVGMKLLLLPYTPSGSQHINNLCIFKPVPKVWEPYIPELYLECIRFQTENGV